jgi:hypothetical protein
MKTKGSGLNGSKRIKFPPESNFDLLLLFSNIWTVLHFQMIGLIFLRPDFDLLSDDEIATYTLFSLRLF